MPIKFRGSVSAPCYTAQASGPGNPDSIQLIIARARLAALEEYRTIIPRVLAPPAPGDAANTAASICKALLSIARLANPGLEAADCSCFESMWQDAAQCAADIAQQPSPVHLLGAAHEHVCSVVGLCAALGGSYCFRENEHDTHNPDNTYWDMVLARRLGTPNSLALLYLAAAQRLRLPLAPWTSSEDKVLLKLQLPARLGALLLDPTQGRLLLLPDADMEGAAGAASDAATGQEALQQIIRSGGVPVAVLPAEAAEQLRPLSLRLLFGYLLMDLKHTYLLSSMPEEALGVIRYMHATDPWSAGDLRDEGLCLYATGRYHEAIAPLRTYLEAVGDGARDAPAVQQALANARWRASRQAQ